MTYYIIRYCGSYSRPDAIQDFDGEVFTVNGRNFVKTTYRDENDEDREGEETVYTSKKEAWGVILKRIDEHIADMQRKREGMFAMALEDGAFKQTPEQFKDWTHFITIMQPDYDFITKRMEEVK